MKSTVIVCTIAAAAMGFGSLSYAQGEEHFRDGRGDRQGYSQRDGRDGHRESRNVQRSGQYQPPQYSRQGQYGHNDRYQQRDQYRQRDRYQQRDQYQQHGQYGQYGGQYGGQWAARAPRYQRGDQLPYQFRQRQYYVNDWRAHHGLYAPPYGYQWVQADGGDYLLVALATGLIANLLLSQ